MVRSHQDLILGVIVQRARTSPSKKLKQHHSILTIHLNETLVTLSFLGLLKIEPNPDILFEVFLCAGLVTFDRPD